MPESDPFICALAAAEAQPAAAFSALCALAQSLVGARLFTVTMLDRKARVARRLFSNLPEAYAVSGAKPLIEDDWTRHVIDAGKIFVGNDLAALARVFSDHELIASLGCQSAINVPVIVAGEVLGTINCLDVEGHYTPARIAAAEALKLPGGGWGLPNRQCSRIVRVALRTGP